MTTIDRQKMNRTAIKHLNLVSSGFFFTSAAAEDKMDDLDTALLRLVRLITSPGVPGDLDMVESGLLGSTMGSGFLFF